MRRRPRSRAAGAALAAATLVAATAACGDDADVGADRMAQVRAAAADAGLPDEVADVLALAARGATATFQVTYAGQDGAEITVSQAPPDRRVDAVTAGLIVQSQVVRDGIAYQCELPADGTAGDPLDCTRTQGAVPAQGAFTVDALQAFTEELGAALDTTDLTVEARTIADVDATCLVSAPMAGTPIDRAGPGVDTICLSAEGAQLLLDVGGDRLVATTYTTDVPVGTFDV